MKSATIPVFVLACIAAQLFAQSPEATVKEKMKVFAPWVGRWQGEGSMQMGPGEPKKSTVNEKFEFKLDGVIGIVEGLGKTIDPTTNQEMVVHQAFGVLSYDFTSSQYKIRTYLKDGRGGEGWFNVTGENTFQWGFDIPNAGKTRYTIVLDPARKTWNEIGEFSRDGSTWSKFFEMNLKKTE